MNLFKKRECEVLSQDVREFLSLFDDYEPSMFSKEFHLTEADMDYVINYIHERNDKSIIRQLDCVIESKSLAYDCRLNNLMSLENKREMMRVEDKYKEWLSYKSLTGFERGLIKCKMQSEKFMIFESGLKSII